MEAGDFGAVVADVEEEVVDGDGADAGAVGEGGGAGELGRVLVGGMWEEVTSEEEWYGW